MRAGRILVVGVCTAGKSTLVNSLRQLGYAAYTVAQEHSSVPMLWRLRNPDFVIYLDVDYTEARRRRPLYWGPSRLLLERARLAHARAHAGLVLDTTGLTRTEVLLRVLSALGAKEENGVGVGDTGRDQASG